MVYVTIYLRCYIYFVFVKKHNFTVFFLHFLLFLIGYGRVLILFFNNEPFLFEYKLSVGFWYDVVRLFI